MNIDDEIGLLTIQSQREIKLAGKLVGWLLEHKDGHKILLVRRTLKDFVLAKGVTMISHAMEENKASLPLERSLISKAQRLGAEVVAIHVVKLKRLYCTSLEAYVKKARGGDKVRTKRGMPQRALNLEYFVSEQNVGKIDDCLPDLSCLKVSHQLVIKADETEE